MLRRILGRINLRQVIFKQRRTKTQEVVLFRNNQETTYLRKLGLLETMYHNLHLKGSDIYDEYFEFKTSKNLTNEDLNLGLSLWIKRHPWLRISMKDRGGGDILNRFHLFEVPEVTTEVLSNVQCSEEELSEVARDHFKLIMDNTERIPLWRLVQIQPYNQVSDNDCNTHEWNTDFTYRWLFVHHHIVSDGIYIIMLIQDLLFYLEHAQERSLSLEDIEELPFPPAIEDLLPHAGESKLSLPPLSPQNESELYALEAYEAMFSSEIRSLANSPEVTLHKEMNLGCDQTKLFHQLCRDNGTTITGLSLAVTAYAFSNLLKDSLSSEISTVVVPAIYTIDLRRYILDETYSKLFPGCASLHMSLYIRINMKNGTNNMSDILSTAAKISGDIARVVKDKEPVKLFRDIVHHDLYLNNSKTKDPFVIYFTNAMNMDNNVTPNRNCNLKLHEFKVLTHVGIQCMPVFAIIVWTRESKFTLESLSAANYTSVTTHSLLSQHINDIFQLCIEYY
ncbi:hypothetical protein FSP39_021768 [Pinctada imbricata]|uniref:Condensation domain-containing protein n=1 Tax=Pinctada imbricata TaxID=66713 RepID=A0AA88XG84_PINIB|nr:hypothetical protein FSP39_021768 [Pinctada imbricata]